VNLWTRYLEILLNHPPILEDIDASETMEVVEGCTEILANRQVLDVLKKYPSKKQTNLATILYETTSYLESSPAATSTLNDISEFLDVLKERKYDLTKIEKVQIVNLKPKNETELLVIVDNIDERLNEQQKLDLLALIQSHLEKPMSNSSNRQPNKRQRT